MSRTKPMISRDSKATNHNETVLQKKKIGNKKDFLHQPKQKVWYNNIYQLMDSHVTDTLPVQPVLEAERKIHEQRKIQSNWPRSIAFNSKSVQKRTIQADLNRSITNRPYSSIIQQNEANPAQIQSKTLKPQNKIMKQEEWILTAIGKENVVRVLADNQSEISLPPNSRTVSLSLSKLANLGTERKERQRALRDNSRCSQYLYA